MAGILGACIEPASLLEAKFLRETTLDELPSGHGTADDAFVRVLASSREGGGGCSGAVIGRRHVLTAAYCAARPKDAYESAEESFTPGQLRVEFGGAFLPWGRVGVRGVRRCPGFDIMVLLLGLPIPPEVPILEIAYTDPRADDGFDLVGFGAEQPPRTIVGSTWELSRHRRGGTMIQWTPQWMTLAVHSTPGDSGAPIVDVARGHIWAVVSKMGRDDRQDFTRTRAVRPVGCRNVIESSLRSAPDTLD